MSEPTGDLDGPGPDDGAERRDLTQRALDLGLYAPAGYVLRTIEDFPALAARGRQHLELQVRNARVVGEFVVTAVGRSLQRRLAQPGRAGGDDQGTAAPGDDGRSVMRVVPEAEPAPDTGAPGTNGTGAVPAPSPPVRMAPAGDRTAAVAADGAIEGYDSLSASQVVRRLDSLGPDELRAVLRHEAATRNRRTILHRAQQLLGADEAPGP